MRPASVMIALMLLVPCAVGQQSESGPTKISGCLMNMNGNFWLTTESGDRYLVKGDHDSMFSHNGQQVEIHGTVSSGKKSSKKGNAAKLQVSDIKMVAQTCR